MWFGVTLVGHLIDVPRQEVTPLLIVNQPDGMVFLTASATEVKRIQAHTVGTAGRELLGVEGHEPLARRLKRRERASCPGQKLVQLECKKGPGRAIAATIPFGFARYRK
jgi:hypothetical protein